MGTPGTEPHEHGQLVANKGTKKKPGEKPQQVKCLPCKNGDLSSDPQVTQVPGRHGSLTDVSMQEVQTEDPKSKPTSSTCQTGGPRVQLVDPA